MKNFVILCYLPNDAIGNKCKLNRFTFYIMLNNLLPKANNSAFSYYPLKLVIFYLAILTESERKRNFSVILLGSKILQSRHFFPFLYHWPLPRSSKLFPRFLFIPALRENKVICFIIKIKRRSTMEEEKKPPSIKKFLGVCSLVNRDTDKNNK